MPSISATAPGKVILCGEHAVVYSQPALAVPVTQVNTRAVVEANPLGHRGQIEIHAPDIHLNAQLSTLAADHPLSVLFETIRSELKIPQFPSFRITIKSSIPVAAGMGSGAAVSVAVIRAVTNFLGRPLDDRRTSDLAFEVEKTYHGTPSGIDNTVIAFARPIYYVRNKPVEILKVSSPFMLVIADSGIKSSTANVVQDLKKHWQTEPVFYENVFNQIGVLVQQARNAIERGRLEDLGYCMTQNHRLLQNLDVSCTKLDELVSHALHAGAFGAKLSGAGRGGNMIALVNAANSEQVEQALKEAGATRTICTTILSNME